MITIRDYLVLFFPGQEEFRTRYAGECLIDNACPNGCTCDGTIVDCSGRGLKEIPRDIPLYTTELYEFAIIACVLLQFFTSGYCKTTNWVVLSPMVCLDDCQTW